jgi:hypothetical protein
MVTGRDANMHPESSEGLTLAKALEDEAIALAHWIAESISPEDNLVTRFAEYVFS